MNCQNQYFEHTYNSTAMLLVVFTECPLCRCHEQNTCVCHIWLWSLFKTRSDWWGQITSVSSRLGADYWGLAWTAECGGWRRTGRKICQVISKMLITKNWFACMSWSILGTYLMGKVRILVIKEIIIYQSHIKM